MLCSPLRRTWLLLPCLARAITFVISICSKCQNIPSRGTDIHSCLSQASTQMVPTAKKVESFARAAGKHIYRWNFPSGHAGRTNQLQEAIDSHLVCLTQTPSCRSLQPRLWHCKRRQIPFLFQPLLQPGQWWHQWPFQCLQGTSRECQPAGRGHLRDTTFMDQTRGVKTS